MIADNSDAYQIEKRMKTAAKRIHELAPQVGVAKQVIEYDSDMRKNLLAKYMVPALKAGESAVAAEAHARADEGYQAELQSRADRFSAAATTLAMDRAEYTSFDAARSLLSFQRETLKSMPE